MEDREPLEKKERVKAELLELSEAQRLQVLRFIQNIRAVDVDNS